MQEVKYRLHFSKGYIANPYWVELAKLIDIQKGSGMNRAKSETKRKQALEDYLRANNLTTDDYQALEQRAARQWYQVDDLDQPEAGHQSNEIVIPGHQWYGAAAYGASQVTKALRVASPEQIRTILHIGDSYTGKSRPDGVWERFVVVKSGIGGKLSNQRGLRSNEYISDFETELPVSFPDDVDAAKVKHFFAWIGENAGPGASRKFGWGRYKIVN
jgi:hypothetical protein